MEYRRGEQLNELRGLIFSRQTEAAPTVPVSDSERFPTSSLQQAGFAILFLFPTIAFLIVCLRVYSRQKMKQFGWGTFLILFQYTSSSMLTI